MTSGSDTGEWQPIPVDARYTRRNADRAMAGYVVRGIVELITNARDSGIRMQQGGQLGREVLIEKPVELVKIVKADKTCDFVVRDRFEGMSATTMRQRLLKYGQMASGFSSAQGIRGLNARGAKDAAMLGEVRFESIHDGRLASCRVRQGAFTEPVSTPVTRMDRGRLQILEGNGTVVTLSPFGNVTVPTFATLAKDLERHIEIRYRPQQVGAIPLDASEMRPKGRTKERRILGFVPEGDVLGEHVVEVPGYTDVSGEARLILRKSRDPLRVPTGSVTRLWRSEAGILVGDGRTAHDISFFGAAGASDTAGRYLFGTLEAPQIAELLTQFEENEVRRGEDPTLPVERLNPSQVTDPDRLGLNREHPFVIALIDAVRPLLEKALAQIEEDLRPTTAGEVDAKLRALLEKLGEELAEKLEIEEGEARGSKIPKGLSFIPPNIRIVIGDRKRVGIYYRSSEAQTEARTCQVSTESTSIELTEGSVELQPDPDTGFLRGYLDIRGIALTDSAVTIGQVTGARAVLRVSVRDEVGPKEIQLDKDLQFSRSRYTSIPKRQKAIDVYGDPTLEGKSIVITVSGDKVHLSQKTIDLVFDPTLGVCKAQFRVKCDEEVNEELLAVCEDFSDSSHIIYRDLGGKPRINFEFVNEPSFRGVRRFKWEITKNQVVIAAKHPTVARVLGPYADSKTGKSWPGQNNPQARAVLAEIVAEAFVDRKIQKELPTMSEGPHNLVDPVDYEDQRYSYFDEILTICHKALTPAYSS